MNEHPTEVIWSEGRTEKQKLNIKLKMKTVKNKQKKETVPLCLVCKKIFDK